MSGCPVHHSTSTNAACSSDTINPSNNMPSAEILHTLPTSPDAALLSTARESSTIPRSDGGSTWQYPSPLMFYNALHRKGKGVPADSVSDMVAIHNQLNEAVWSEVAEKEQFLAPQCGEPKLKRFMGRPDELSPTAWWHVWVRGGEAPFDRHDWVVERCGCEVRYVIDYYSGHDVPGEASFNVDIRPALDSPQACLDRMRLFWRKHFPDHRTN